MRPYDGYLFDLDGTLVDTAPDINRALNHALEKVGHRPVTEALTRHWVGHGARVMVQQALRYHMELGELELAAPPNTSAATATAAPEFRQPDLEPLLADFLRYYTAHIADHSRPYPGVVETLERLRGRGARLAVVTNKLTRLAQPLLDALDLSRLFDSIVCGDTAALPKPAADPAWHACLALELTPAQALFVGDSETDVACARAAGCPIVCVSGGYNHGIAPEALGADAVIDSFWELV